MALTLFGVLLLFLSYAWILGGVPWALTLIASVVAIATGLYLIEGIRRRASLVGWSAYSTLCFWMASGLTGFALYVLVVC